MKHHIIRKISTEKNLWNRILDYRVFFWVNLIVLFAKLLYASFFLTDIDGYEDWSIAQNVVKFHQYSEFIKVGPTAYKLPGYPLFLSFFILIFGNLASYVIVWVQSIIFFFIPFLLIKILKLFDLPKVGFTASYLFIFSPAYFFYSNVIEATNIFIPVFMLWIYKYLQIYLQKNTNNTDYFVLGFLTAILSLIQVVEIPILLVLMGILFLHKKIPGKPIILFCCTAFIVYSPWVIRNYWVFDQIVLTKSPKWQNIYLSYTEDSNLLNQLKIIPADKEIELRKLRPKTSEFKMEEYYKSAVESALKGKESLPIIKGLQNAFFLWYVPPRYFYDNSPKILVGRKFFVVLLNILTLVSLVNIFKANKKIFYLFMLIFVGFTIPYMIGHALNTRFKLDFEWIQFVLIALFLLKNETKPKLMKDNTLSEIKRQ